MSGLRESVPVEISHVVALFYRGLTHQLYWIAGIAVLVALVIAWRSKGRELTAEPPARTVLRWGFAALWIADGALAHQGTIPLNLPSSVLSWSATGTPHWLHVMVNSAVGLLDRFPISVTSASMWIDFGLAVGLLASRGQFSRFVGGLSMLWALVLWVTGESLGGLFSPTPSLLFGWPGAALLYAVAGAWLLLPVGFFKERFSPLVLRTLSVLFGLAVVIQLWPTHDFWHGGNTNPFRDTSYLLSSDAQPSGLSRVVLDVGKAAASLGGGFNVIVLLWLVACAIGLWRASSGQSQWGIWTTVGGALLVWVAIQDTGIFGGVATDVNSMLPLAVLALAGLPLWHRIDSLAVPLPKESRWSLSALVGGIAVAMLAVGFIPLINDATSAGAETTFFLATNNGVTFERGSLAPSFHLTDQWNKPFSFPTHNGKFTVLTFLDPRCWTDCPLLSHQLEDLDAMLTPTERRHVQLVAVAADPFHERVSDLRAFIKKNYLGSLDNFIYVTGQLPAMQATWASYDIGVTMRPGWRMSIHSDAAYLIDPSGQVRVFVPDDPSDDFTWAAETSSAAELLKDLHQIGLR
jgi:cytochrome oxidase Cu insertion factor (SCO1/SenC/PrrC family)